MGTQRNSLISYINFRSLPISFFRIVSFTFVSSQGAITRSGMGVTRPTRLRSVDAKFKLSHGSEIVLAGTPAPLIIQTECVEMRKKPP